jgi:3-phosphoshikimate 1-carboxyvinyltransferase
MGSEVKVKNNEVKINGHGRLNGIEVNLQNAPDLLPTVAALRCHGRWNNKNYRG